MVTGQKQQQRQPQQRHHIAPPPPEPPRLANTEKVVDYGAKRAYEQHRDFEVFN